MKIQHILFPTDFSELAQATEARVRQFADHFDSRITVIHVIGLPPAFYGMPSDYFFRASETNTLEGLALETIRTVLPERNVARVVKHGDPAAEIASFADTNSVDLIMMPTHGSGPFRRALIGSVTAKLLHDANCPVWTMAHAEEPGTEFEVVPKRIICAIDLVPESVHVIKSAVDLAQSFAATLWLAHVVPQVRSFREEYSTQADRMAIERQTFYADHARQEIAKIQAETGTNLHVCVDAGPVAAVLAEIVRKHKASLLITGRGAAEHFMGSVRSRAYPIIHEAPCPVISL